MHGATGQDEFGQGYNVAVDLYNAIVAGKKVDPVLQPAVSLFMTKDNVDELFRPAKLPLGAVPQL